MLRKPLPLLVAAALLLVAAMLLIGSKLVTKRLAQVQA